jgi:hypothetical protein
VSTFYRVLSPPGSIPFTWKGIWRTKALPRVVFFAWTTVRSKIPTIDNLCRRGMIMVNRCWLCESDGESMDHLLLHCKLANALWNVIFSQFGLCWVMLGLVRELFACWWTGVARGVLWFGRWFLCVLCGVFGGNVMLDTLKTRHVLLRKFFIPFFLSFTLGLQAGLPRLLLAFRIFFLVPPLPLRLSLVYFLCT